MVRIQHYGSAELPPLALQMALGPCDGSQNERESMFLNETKENVLGGLNAGMSFIRVHRFEDLDWISRSVSIIDNRNP